MARMVFHEQRGLHSLTLNQQPSPSDHSIGRAELPKAILQPELRLFDFPQYHMYFTNAKGLLLSLL